MSGPDRHNFQLHRSVDSAGTNLTSGYVPKANGSGGWTFSAGGAAALDDLSDVTITSPVAGNRLRYNGSQWVNTTLIWRPVMVLDPTSGNYLPVTASGDAVMTEA